MSKELELEAEKYAKSQKMEGFDSLDEAVKYSEVPKTTFHKKLNSNKLINGKQYEYKN